MDLWLYHQGELLFASINNIIFLIDKITKDVFCSYPEQPRRYYPEIGRRPTSPSFPEPSSSSSSSAPTEDESKLTREEQNQAVNKLKEVYFPPFPKKGRIPNLYFREHYNSINRNRGKGNVEEDEDGKICAVCLDDFEAREVVMVTPCNHMFHKDCIIPWVKSQGQCPVCRYAICDRFKEKAAAAAAISSNSNVMGNHHQEPYELELISIIRAMEEAFMSENMSRLH